MYNLLENIFASKELYQHLMNPVCNRFGISHTELFILLFLANHPDMDTAKDIVCHRHMTKSSVSMAVKSLQQKGLVTGKFTESDHRSVHLTICPSAFDIILEGNKIQKDFHSVLFDNFSEEESELIKKLSCRISQNITEYMKREHSIVK